MSRSFVALLLSAAFGALVQPSIAAAQTDAREVQPATSADAPQLIDFAADQIDYDDETEIVTARGNVVVQREGDKLEAGEVEWNRKTGRVEARGSIRMTDARGNVAYGERVDLTDTLKDGSVDAFLLVLENGGRLAAHSGKRENGRSILDHAIYSPCDVAGSNGCPKTPVWQIKAGRITHDPIKQRIRYRDAQLEVFGIPVLYTPGLSHPDREGRNASGLLVPDFRLDRTLGLATELPYYLSFTQNSDLTITPTIYTNVNPALGLEYRHLAEGGPLRIGGIVTYSSKQIGTNAAGTTLAQNEVRGALWSNGRFQHSRHWRSTYGVRLASDDTFLRRYDISRDDTLRNFYSLEYQSRDMYFGVEGWAFQGLRSTDEQGQMPVVLPLIDFRYAPRNSFAGGTISARINTAAVTRWDGQDMQRATAETAWRASRYTSMGQKITATAQLRAEAFHMTDQSLAQLQAYAGRSGWEGRVIPAAALDVEWPFAGPVFGGQQTLTPRLQLVSSPTGLNDNISNEDSRSVELDDLNLFDINRFPGFDRWEGGTRMTYGAQWSLDRRKLRVEAELGQSYRFSQDNGLFPSGTGFANDFSDVVGRATLRFGSGLDITHRFRLDKDNFKIRRNEIDVTFGTRKTYATVGYVKLNRDIAREDLGDREEVRVGGRLAFARYWSLFGSAIIDLTSHAEDPLSNSDGFEPVRHRVGLAYEDECFSFGLTWRRDYTHDRDFRRGNTFLFTIGLKTLGQSVSQGSAAQR